MKAGSLNFRLSQGASRSSESSDLCVTVSTASSSDWTTTELRNRNQSSIYNNQNGRGGGGLSINGSENNRTAGTATAAGGTCYGSRTGRKQAGTLPDSRQQQQQQRQQQHRHPRQSQLGHRVSGAANEGNPEAAAAGLMSCCVQNTVDQAKQMRVKGPGCLRDNPYAGLDSATFGKLLKDTRPPAGRRRRGRKAKGAKKVNWCKPKPDECENIRMQLCPKLGQGHTHEQLIEEMAPLLLQAAQSLNCQLREICRRVFFMHQNLPHMTAPTLANFHAILAKIVRMLMADFASFPTGLKLPDKAASQ